MTSLALLLIIGLASHPSFTAAQATQIINTAAPGSSCATIWTASPNTNYAGGTAQSSANSPEACQSVCLTIQNCVAIDFNPAGATGAQCFTLTSLTGLKFTGTNSGITNYVRNTTCSSAQTTIPGCSFSWAPSANTNYAGGAANAAASVTNCQTACINIASCVAIDFNPAGGSGLQCFILTSLTGQKFTGTNSGITNYALTRNCGGTTGPTVCVPVWTPALNTNYAGGTANPAADVTNCQAACISNLACVAIDFNPAGGANARCYLLTNLLGQKFSGGTSGITHYDLDRCPSAETSPYFMVFNKLGGALSIEESTNRVRRSAFINNAAIFTASQCLASNVPGFNNTGNCSSWSIMNTNVFLRDLWGNAIVQNRTTQGALNFPSRFALDSSFYAVPSSSSPGFIQLQPAAHPASDYYSLNQYLEEDDDSSDLSLFFISPVVISNTPITTTCPNMWSRISGASGDPGYWAGNLGLTTCRQRCLTFPNCIGVSISSNACWFALNAATVVGQDPGFTYYELSRVYAGTCLWGCRTTFSPQTTNFANYSVNTYWVSSSQECREVCYSRSSCVGVNWLFYSTTRMIQCTTYHATGLLTGTVTYWARRDSFKACGGCDPTTYITVNTTDSAAVQQRGVAGFRDCHTACINNRMCTGYDLRNASGECFLSLNNSMMVDVTASSVHVDITRSTCGSGCRDKWDLYTNTNLDGTNANGATSDAACRKACQADNTCVAASWNLSANTCHLATSSSTRNLEGTSPGWITYFLNRAWYCGSHVISRTPGVGLVTAAPSF